MALRVRNKNPATNGGAFRTLLQYPVFFLLVSLAWAVSLKRLALVAGATPPRQTDLAVRWCVLEPAGVLFSCILPRALRAFPRDPLCLLTRRGLIRVGHLAHKEGSLRSVNRTLLPLPLRFVSGALTDFRMSTSTRNGPVSTANTRNAAEAKTRVPRIFPAV